MRNSGGIESPSGRVGAPPLAERASVAGAVAVHPPTCFSMRPSTGISFLAVPIRTTEGESFVLFDGHLWELTPWMPGAADYERSPSAQKLGAAMTALAKFHLAVQRLSGDGLAAGRWRAAGHCAPIVAASRTLTSRDQ